MNDEPKDGGTVTVVINPQTASKRTRNRVKDGGPEFALVKRGSPQTFRKDSALLRSPKTGWFGWLPLDEINMRSKSE